MPSDGQGDEWERLRWEFAAWQATPQRLRAMHGLPRTQKEWSELKGVADRTLRRWKEREDFQEAVATHKARIDGSVEGASVVPSMGRPRAKTRGEDRTVTVEDGVTAEDDALHEAGMSRHELLYRRARDDIFERAAEGSSAAVELMMKYWGQELVDAERAEQEVFRDMTDEELVGELVRLAGSELVARTLAASVSA